MANRFLSILKGKENYIKFSISNEGIELSINATPIDRDGFTWTTNINLAHNVYEINKYVKKLRVYLSINNLFVITKYKGVDPEINQGGLALGVDANNFYPKTRTFLFGANLSF